MFPHNTIDPRLDIFLKTIIHLGYVSVYECGYVPNNYSTYDAGVGDVVWVYSGSAGIIL